MLCPPPRFGGTRLCVYVHERQAPDPLVEWELFYFKRKKEVKVCPHR